MSEAYGRKWSVMIPMFALMVFTFASAAAKDLQTLLITRFFAGVFGVAPLSNVGGVLADIWPATQRGAALLTWGLAVIIGPPDCPDRRQRLGHEHFRVRLEVDSMRPLSRGIPCRSFY